MAPNYRAKHFGSGERLQPLDLVCRATCCRASTKTAKKIGPWRPFVRHGGISDILSLTGQHQETNSKHYQERRKSVQSRMDADGHGPFNPHGQCETPLK